MIALRWQQFHESKSRLIERIPKEGESLDEECLTEAILTHTRINIDVNVNSSVTYFQNAYTYVEIAGINSAIIVVNSGLSDVADGGWTLGCWCILSMNYSLLPCLRFSRVYYIMSVMRVDMRY